MLKISSKIFIKIGVFLFGVALALVFSLFERSIVQKSYALSQFGSSAEMVLGQGKLDEGYYTPTDISSDNNYILISDSRNNRVLFYDKGSVLRENPQITLILGQESMLNNEYNGPTRSSVSGRKDNGSTSPVFAQIKSGKIFVSEPVENRVLIWNEMPSESNEPADLVLGQPDFLSNSANNGGITASSMSLPMKVYYDGIRLFVAEYSNNRVLIWNEFPSTNGEPADIVLGQPDMTSNTSNNGGLGASSLSAPSYVYSDGQKLYVADRNNNRVLIWNEMPSENNEPADLVLGQPNFTTNSSGTSDVKLNTPNGIFSDGNRMFVTEFNNHRVLVWTEIPSVSSEPADFVIGQPNMTSGLSNNGGVSASSLYNPIGVLFDDEITYVADSNNNRILLYRGNPEDLTWDNMADYVLGQSNMSKRLENKKLFEERLNSPWNVNIGQNKMAIADEVNGRVLLWNDLPTKNDDYPDLALGQADLLSYGSNRGVPSVVTAGTLYSPSSVWTNGNILFVSDYSNNRVLKWNEFPTENGENADIVLGQNLMTTRTANEGGRSNSSLSGPTQVYSDGLKLYVVDRNNHRVLIWNEIPSVNKKAADLELGQPDMVSGTANNGGISGARLNNPYGVWSNGIKVIIADYSNHRVLIWNEFPLINGEAADIVLGQPNMTSNTANNGGISNSTMNSPATVLVDNKNRLFVADRLNNRVLIWNEFPTENGEAADIVLGQTSFIGNVSYRFSGLKGFCEPRGLALNAENNVLYVSDRCNNRILVFHLGPQNTFFESESEYTNSLEGNLFNFGSTDAKEMMVSLDSSFSGLSWEPFSTSKLIDLPVGDGLKSVFAKFRDFGNYESSVLSATVVLDTVGHKPVITQLGLIKNIPNKDSLYYYFTANKARIYGTAEANSTVQFERVNGTKYTTQTDGSGNFLIIIDLPNGETKLTYSSTDLAGNVSGSRTITLNINPSYGTSTEATSEDTVTPDEEELTEEEPNQTDQEETPVVKSLLVVDSDGNILSNKTIVIEGKEYKTDERGYIHTDQGFTSDLIASIEGRNYTIKPSSTYLTLTEVEKENQGKLNSLYYIIPIALFLTIIVAVFIKRRSR